MKPQNFMTEDTLAWLLDNEFTGGTLSGSTRPVGIVQGRPGIERSQN